MKLSELTVGNEYAIVPSWTYSSRESRQPENVRKSDVVKATIISLDKYEYDSGTKSYDPTTFTLAQAGSRSVGILVRADGNANSQYIYWTSRLADIVALWSDLEPRWTKEETEQEAKEREENERRERAERKRNEIVARVHSARASVINTTKELLGNSSGVVVDTTGYGEEVRAIVTMGLDEYERLIELAYEGKATA